MVMIIYLLLVLYGISAWYMYCWMQDSLRSKKTHACFMDIVLVFFPIVNTVCFVVLVIRSFVLYIVTLIRNHIHRDKKAKQQLWDEFFGIRLK